MPWSPTTQFPHPLANIQSTNADRTVTNFLSYVMVEILTWQGLGDLVNKFREQTLGLSPVSTIWAPGAISRLKVPHTYCWSPSLIPKPQDWGQHIGISGFYFLSLAHGYTPPPNLAQFLASGPPPVYIGFGSIVVADPNALTQKIIRAVEIAGCRAVVSKGWGGIGGDSLQVPDNIFLLDNCPHDWLFPQCAAVVHHGGAGTTAAGIRCGKPTVVVPFFGDQAFWGNMLYRAGAGPEPLPQKQLTAEALAARIKIALTPEAKQKATELGEQVRAENGVDEGVQSFHRTLTISRCDILPDRVAVWRTRKGNIKLSAVAAAVIVGKGLIENGWDGLRLCRHREWLVDEGALEPLSGGGGALMGTIGSILGGVSEFPKDIGKVFAGSSKGKERQQSELQGGEASGPAGSGSDTANSPAVTAPTSPLRSRSTTSLESGHLSPPPLRPSVSHTSSTSNALPRTPTPTTQERMDTALAASGGISKIVEAGLRSPLDFTLGIAQGFRNAPRLYNDTTLRPPPSQITGIQSGIKTAGKELALGIYDGVTGLVTQPLHGAKTGGASGAFKGAGKGIGGLVLKGGAGFWSVPAYLFKGIHSEVLKLSVKDVDKGIWSMRMRQGLDEAEQLQEGTVDYIVERWEKKKSQPATKRQSSFFGGLGKEKGKPKEKEEQQHRKEKPKVGKRHSSSFSSIFGSSDQKAKQKSTIYNSNEYDEDARVYHTASSDEDPEQERQLLEEAIRRSVAETSHGNPSEDAEVEAAIRASLQEPDIAEAMKASLRNAHRPQQEPQQQYSPPQQQHSPHPQPHPQSHSQPQQQPQQGQSSSNEDAELEEAMRRSMDPSSQPPPLPRRTTEDEQLAEAIRQSLVVSREHDERARALSGSGNAPHSSNIPPTAEEDDEDLKRALEESLRTAAQPRGAPYQPHFGGGAGESSSSAAAETSPTVVHGSGGKNWSGYVHDHQQQQPIPRKPAPPITEPLSPPAYTPEASGYTPPPSSTQKHPTRAGFSPLSGDSANHSLGAPAPPPPPPAQRERWEGDDGNDDEEDWEVVERVMRESLEEQERKKREMEEALAEVVARRQRKAGGGGSSGGGSGGAAYGKQ